MNLDSTYVDQQRAAVANQLPKIVPAADAARISGLSTTLVLQAAQQGALAINRARNAVKYGPNSSQVEDMDARLQACATLTQSLQVAQARARLQAPSIPAGSAGIFGRVADGSGVGVAKASVVVVGETGAKTNTATTAADGSYQLVLTFPRAASSRTKAATGSAKSSVTIRLGVVSNGQTVLTDAEAITLQAGDIVLRELTIPSPAGTPTAG